VLTAHERLRSQTRYPLSTLSCLRTQKPACVRARQTNLAKLLCNRRSGLTLPPKLEFAPHDSSQLADPMPTQAIRRPLKSHR
jgi:hypothetical protein